MKLLADTCMQEIAGELNLHMINGGLARYAIFQVSLLEDGDDANIFQR